MTGNRERVNKAQDRALECLDYVVDCREVYCGRWYFMNKKTIYQFMNGEISLEAVAIPEELQLEDEFAGMLSVIR